MMLKENKNMKSYACSKQLVSIPLLRGISTISLFGEGEEQVPFKKKRDVFLL